MKSFFIKDDSENNQGYEHMLDFQMSWVMRVPANEEITNLKLKNRCLSILRKLIDKRPDDEIEVISVNVWKQWKRIDVHANVILKCNGIVEKHLVVLEDKAYTMVHDDQLNRYERTIKAAYDEDAYLKEFKKHFWVITFFSPDETGYKALKSTCEASNAPWNLLSYDEVLDDNTPTGSEHFDDFWINEW